MCDWKKLQQFKDLNIVVIFFKSTAINLLVNERVESYNKPFYLTSQLEISCEKQCFL